MHIVYGKEQADRLKEKYTVLELDTVKVEEVDKNLTLFAVVDTEKLGVIDLPQLAQWVKLHEDLIRNLKKTNKKLWEIEDNIRTKESNQEFDEEFIKLARSVYIENDERASIKKEINQKYNSDLVEEKSYKNY